MRSSDWSSDVCSSDLKPGILQLLRPTFGPTLRIGLCGTIEDCRRRLLGTKRRETKPWRRLDFLWNESFTDLGSTNRSNQSKSGLDLGGRPGCRDGVRSEAHTSELQSLMRLSYAVFCLKKNKT